MDRGDFLFREFLRHMAYEPTECQRNMLRDAARFLTSDDGDIMVVNGYAGTGKTTAVSAVIDALASLEIRCILLAPTGRSAKVLSQYAGRPAHTIHKGIYRQKSVGEGGSALFSLAPNKSRDTLFVVDEVSLIGIDSAGEQGRTSFGSGNLLEDLVTYVRNGNGCRLMMIGDSAQLPPVGMDESPALSKDYLAGFGGVSFSTLTTVVRQAALSGILHNATILREMIRNGNPAGTYSSLPLNAADFPDVERVGGAELLETLSDAYSRYGEDETIVLCRSNKRAIRYNLGIRAQVQYKEDKLVRGERLMVVRNCYQFLDGVEEMDYIANGDMATLVRIGHYVERYGLHFADATLCFPDYNDLEVDAKVCLDTLESESASLTAAQQDALFNGVYADYDHISGKRKRYSAVREDPFYNAIQLKYAEAITCHKSQGGQWKCVFIDNPFWQDEHGVEDLKWLYTALTRAVEKVYLVNFKDSFFK